MTKINKSYGSRFGSSKFLGTTVRRQDLVDFLVAGKGSIEDWQKLNSEVSMERAKSFIESSKIQPWANEIAAGFIAELWIKNGARF